MRFHNPLKRTKVRIRRPRIRIRWRKNSSWWAVGVAVAFFATLFAMHIVLMRHAESIVHDVLDSRVRQATQGFYSTSFGHIEVSYTNKDLIIHNLRLFPDSSRLINNEGRPFVPSSVYDILIPQLRIEGIDLKRAYLQKSLNLQRLAIVQPDIRLYLNLDLSPTATDSLKKDINKRLAPFFKNIRASKVAVINGKVELQAQKNQQISKIKTTISFDADNLVVETALRPQDSDWMQVDRFIAQAGQMAGYIADKTYLVRLKSITASSADSSFYLRGFQLLPTSHAASLLSRNPDLDRIYTIRVPQLYTYGVDYEAIYNQQNFLAGEITLFSPSFELYDAKPTEAGEKENFKPEDLYPAIENIFNKVAVGKVVIKHGRAQVRNREELFLTKLSVDVNDAAVYNFELDSAAQYRTDKLFFADSVNFHLRNYQLRLSDNLHLLKADELMVNSNNSLISANNLRIEPDTVEFLKTSIPALYAASVPELTIDGIDLLELYNNNHLRIDSLLVETPDIQYSQQIARKKKDPDKNTPFQEEDLYGLMSDYLYQLNIKHLSINGGIVTVFKEIEDSVEVFNTKINFAHLWNLQIDSSSAYQLNKLFYADNFDLQIADYRHKLPDGVHAIEVKSMGVSTLRDRIFLSGVRIYNEPGFTYPFDEIRTYHNPTLLDITVPFLELNGVDILKSYLDKKLEVGEVVLPNPVVHIASRISRKNRENTGSGIVHSSALYDLIEDFAEVVSVKTLRLSNAEILTAFYAPNGLLQLNSSNASVAIDNFRFDRYTSRNPKRLFFADAVSVSARDFLADLPDERYQIKADLLQASTASKNIVAEGVQLVQPGHVINEEALLLQGKKGLLSFNLPLVKITGLDYDKAYYDEMLHVDSIIAESPSLTYLQLARNGKRNKKTRAVIPQTNLYESLSPFFEHLSVGAVKLDNGTLRTVNRRNGETRQNLLVENISISVSNFLVDSAAASNIQRFFYSEDISVHIGGYQWFLPDNEHQVTAGNLELSTRSNLIRASAVKLEPVPDLKAQSSTNSRYNIQVPEVLLFGIPFDDIFEKEEFKLDKLELLNPTIEVRQYAANGNGTGSKPKRRERSLPELLSAGMNLLEINEAVLTNGSLRYVSYGQEKPLDISFPHLEAKLTNFSITPRTRAVASKPFFSDNLEVRVEDWKRLLPDSSHWVEIGTISFSAKDSLLLLRNAQLYPNFDKLATAEQTLLTALVPTIRLEGLDYTKLSNDSLTLKHLWIMEPVVSVLSPAKSAKDSSNAVAVVAEKETKTKKLLSLIKADSIQVADGTLVLRNASETDTSRFELNNIYVNAAGFLYDSLQQNNTERILYTDNLEAGVKNYKALLDNGFYEIEAKNIGLSTGRKELWADSLRITPALDKAEFAKQKEVETDQFTFRNRKILVYNLDMRKLFYDKTIETDKLLIDGFNLYVYRDKRFPYPSAKRPSMPQKSLRNSEWKIMIRETELTNGYIAYAERVRGAREDGFIDLTDFEIQADTISNYPAVLDEGYVTNISASMKLMGKGMLKAQFEIPMGDSTNQHVFYGSLEEMDLDNFNPILENTSFISIRSGQADQINFKVIADAEVAEGSMEFEYDNLRVALVNRRTGKPGGFFRQLASSVANMFVHSSNTVNGEQESLRTGEIEVKRDEKRSIVNYWVKTLIGGFKSSIGI
ncbi:hypothetical protein D770_03210 [Flammeovirgaceae bacterium 311]|nr:hypothetical protein D770_03210 [Flammeovirgaceae bacterium 311]